MSVLPSGSPPETRNTTLNMLNVQIDPRMTAGNNVGRKSGSVTSQNDCQRVAPSTSAASMTSFGIDVSAPMTTTIMKGKPSHTFVATFAVNAPLKLANHDVSVPSSALIAPY